MRANWEDNRHVYSKGWHEASEQPSMEQFEIGRVKFKQNKIEAARLCMPMLALTKSYPIIAPP